jgi:hypothetical protein
MSILRDLVKFDARLPRKLRVQAKDVDCVGDLVDDAGAFAMVRREQFKVLNAIIEFVTIFMVHSLFGQKRPSKVSLHHVAMLKNAMLLSSNRCWDRDPGVTSLNMHGVLAACVFRPGARNLPIAFAARIAELLFSVEQKFALAALVLLHRLVFPALDAGKESFRRSISAPTFRRAWNGAIERVLSELHSVLLQLARAAHKRLLTIFAGESGSLDYGGGRSTSMTAKMPCLQFASLTDRKFIPALRASHRKHLTSSSWSLHNYQCIFHSGIARGAD